MLYRIAHELYVRNVPLIPRMITEHAHGKTGIDINPGATIGKYFFIDHGTGIVVGETTEIGEHVKIYQGVTLGALSTRQGQALRGRKRHPTLGNYVTVYSGASILGGASVIGDGAVIGSNAFITSSVKPGAPILLSSVMDPILSSLKKIGVNRMDSTIGAIRIPDRSSVLKIRKRSHSVSVSVQIVSSDGIERTASWRSALSSLISDGVKPYS